MVPFTIALLSWVNGPNHSSIAALLLADCRSVYLNTDPGSQYCIQTERIDLYLDIYINELTLNQEDVSNQFLEIAQHMNTMDDEARAKKLG